MSETRIYRGRLVNTYNGEEDDILGLEAEGANQWHQGEYADRLAETIQSDREELGSYFSVRYFVTDEPVSADDLELALAKVCAGVGDAEYGMGYTEITGYIGTTERLEVGGHDLLEELKGHIGKYLHLEILYSKTPAPVA